MPPLRLFISHSHEDQVLAKALQTLLADIFGDAIVIHYSSDDAPGGGILAGDTWLEWITTTVRDTDVCIAIFTEISASAEWVTWETGAVTGVAIGGEAPSDRAAPAIRVVPLTFGIDIDRVPAPLQRHQAVSGDGETGVRKLLFMLQQRRDGTAQRARETTARSVSMFLATVREFIERRTREHPLRLQAADLTGVHLLNCKEGLTLEPRDGEIANGIRLHCGPFTGDAHQRWLLHPIGEDIYKITTLDRTQCLSIENDSDKAGAAVILWEYEGHGSQHWQITKPSGAAGVLSTVSLVNAFSGCLLWSAVSGNDVIQSKRANRTNEDWWILLAGRV